jgi:hypothetical protein
VDRAPNSFNLVKRNPRLAALQNKKILFLLDYLLKGAQNARERHSPLEEHSFAKLLHTH